MLIDKIQIKSPKTKKDFNDYYYLRWFVLRKEFEDDLEVCKDELENDSSENTIKKLNTSINDKDYKIYTSEFDEIAKAETLEDVASHSDLTLHL